jgi:hypothetical protein
MSLLKSAAMTCSTTVLALCTAIPSASALTAGSDTASTNSTKQVTYLGHRFDVPRSWPVIDLAAAPTTCVRFDRSAVYLGTPGAEQKCPAHLMGRTEALLVEPAVATAAVKDDAVALEFTGAAGGIKITATYNKQRSVAQDIVTSAALPTSTSNSAPNSTPKPAAATPALAAATVPANSTGYTGLGFDPCDAPSSAVMSDWKRSSPYGAVGIYIGGVNRGCAQPNLTSGWVSQQASLGWHFFPLYVGYQGYGSCGGTCAVISSASQGTSAADDAVNQAASLGFGPGSVLTYDMEAYTENSSVPVVGFESAWTEELHARGYKSGIYGSMGSTVADLVNNYGGGYTMPDVLDFATGNGSASTGNPGIPGIPGTEWADHQRINQYALDVTDTYGGDALSIDRDYLDVRTSPATGSDVVMAANGALATYWTDGGQVWGKSQSQPGGAWSAAQQLTTGGGYVGQVSAVSAMNGTIALYIRNTSGGVSGLSQNTAGGTFQWASLGGSTVSSDPTAIVAANGAIAVYATASDGNVWGTSQSVVGGPFSGWQQLATGGGYVGKVSAVVASTGGIALYIRNTSGGVSGLSQNTAGGTFQWASLGGSTVSSDPTAIVAANGAIAVYATASDGNVWGTSQSVVGGPFSGWQQLTTGGGYTGTVSAVLAATDVIALYVRTTSDSVNGASQDGIGGAFHWDVLGGSGMTGEPTAIVAYNGAIALYDEYPNPNPVVMGDSQAYMGGPFTGWTAV